MTRRIPLTVAVLALVLASAWRASVIAQSPATITVAMLCAAGDGVQVGFRVVPASASQAELVRAADGGGMVCSRHDAVLRAFGFLPKSVDEACIAKCAAIDQNTAEVIARGFNWTPPSAAPGTPPTRMSLSVKAKEIYHGLLTGDSRGIVSYPVVVGGLSDIDLVPLQGSADVLGLYGAAMAAVQAQEVAGLTLKAQVLAAATVADVIAVVDSR